MTVCSGAATQCHSFRQSLMADRIGMVLTEALHGGLTAAEIGQIVDTKLRQLNGNVPTISHSSSDQADGAAASLLSSPEANSQ